MIRRIALSVFVATFLVASFISPSMARILNINESSGPDSPEELGLKAFKEYVEEKTNGEIEIRIHLNDSLGNSQTSLENLTTGTLDLYSGALSYYTKLAPEELSMLTFLYFFKDREHFRNYLNSPIFAQAQDKMLKEGIRFISTEFAGDRGPYRVFLSRKPILHPDDLDGIKLRVWPNDVVRQFWAHMGTSPVVLDWGDVYLALKQGMVDAVTAPLTTVRPARLTEVAPYVTELKQFHQTWPITISEKVWQTLTPDQQQILIDGANLGTKVLTQVVRERAETDIQKMMHDDDATFIRVNTELFEKKALPFYKNLIEDGVISQELFDAAQALK
jgi:TRAP-type C4-dicarboxylate transport system substrate-binding protein